MRLKLSPLLESGEVADGEDDEADGSGDGARGAVGSGSVRDTLGDGEGGQGECDPFI
jgi:hypothetical protein